MKDYYKILEIEENASEEDIKKKYRALSKKYHPDVNPDGAEKFKEIAEAYEILGDKNRRENYHAQKNNPYKGTQFEDIFSQMFGGAAPPNFNQPRRKSAPDKIVKVQITPLESYKGIDKTVRYIKNNQCQLCNGAGGEQQVCGSCRGQGFQIKTFGTGFMVQQVRTACPTCAGRGYTLIHRCHSCLGQGFKGEASEVLVKLPVSVDSGEFLKIENQGDFRNGEYGDLVIQIEVVPSDGYEKINNDLVYNLFLNLEEIKSDKYKIPHPDGDLMTSAPRIFDTSRPLRLRGKGYKGGDMYVKLNVKFEREISESN